MATTSSPSKSKKEKKEKEKEKSQQKNGIERLKIVVRRLPPNLPEEIFWQSVQNWVTEETAIWKSYHQGKFRSRLNKENVPSRAYVAFKTEEQLASFHRDYDGHIFRDKSGNESQAVVEFAPYPKIPPEKKKADARIGTIEQDDDYISFIKSLNQPAAEPTTIEALVASTQAAPQPKTTPLLEALKAEKAAAKEAKEAKEKMMLMRSHAHPPEVLVRKDDGKRKGATHKSAPEAGPISKKAAKKAAALAATIPAGAGGELPNSGNVGPTAARKPPKAPRAMREQQQHSSATHAQPPSSSNTASTTSTTLASSETSTPPARRGRPILGLGSRQFEAALSVVAGGKSRKEREKEKDKEKDNDVHEKKPANAPGGTGESSTPKEAGSLKRERNPRHRDNTIGNPSTSAKPHPPISGILQRGEGGPPAILQREQKSTPAAPGTNTEAVSPQGPPPVPGRGRGRGRGRGGRGGPGMRRGG